LAAGGGTVGYPSEPHEVGAEAAVEAISGAAGQDVSFSLAFSQGQTDIRHWVHGFAAHVVRPAAHEWDEREETPWPIIGEAAKIGLYGFERMAQFFADPSGLGLPFVNEELFWGDAGIGKSIMGTALAVAAISRLRRRSRLNV
jgi:acyl-CoA dehydrogenase